MKMNEKSTFVIRTSGKVLTALDELAWRSRKSRNEFLIELIEGAVKNAGLLEDESIVPQKRPVGRPRKE